MGTYEYRILDSKEQTMLLQNSGVLLDTAIVESKTYSLYHFSNFFVEVISDKVENKIIEITPFLRGDRLEKYTNRIDLGSLI